MSRHHLHYAAQLPALFANTWVPARPDFSHTALHWRDGGLWSKPAGGVRLGVRDNSWVLTHDDETLGETAVGSLEQGAVWLLDHVRGTGLVAHDLAPLDHPAPPQPLGPYNPEIHDWLDTAQAVLSQGPAQRPGASDLQLWPHHLDLATLVTVIPHDDPEHASSVGFGFSLGDGGIDEPYFYVTPWPAPERPVELRLGRWNTHDWVGAVLTETRDPSTVAYFCKHAGDACVALFDR